MSTDRQIADKIVKSVGYKTTVGPTDKAKVAAAAQGIRKPTPAALLAQAPYELYLRGVDPPPPNPLSPVWQADAVYTTTLGNFEATRQDAWNAGFRTVYCQLLHNPLYYDNTVQAMPIFRRDGWTMVGWGTYGQDTDPTEDGRLAAALVKQHNLAGWKANGEAWAEWDLAWKTSAFIQGWLSGGAPCPLGWSVLSSDTANYARAFDYPSALTVAGADIDIEVYGSVNPNYTVAAGLGMLRNTTVPQSRTTMTFSISANGDGPFQDYRTWQGPRRVWTGEYAKPGYTFQQLAR